MRYCAICERRYSDDVNVCEVDGSVLKESIWPIVDEKFQREDEKLRLSIHFLATATP